MASNRTARLPAGITARRLANGSVVYDVRHRPPGGGHRKRTFADVADARTYLSTVQADQARNRYIDPRQGDRTVLDIAELWMVSNPGKRESTRLKDADDLRLRIIPAFGHRRVSSVGPAEAQAAVNGWLTTLAPSTVARTKAVMHSVFAYAEYLEVISRNPVERVKVGSIAPRKGRVLTNDEAERLLGEFVEPYRTAVHVALETGLRWGEVMGLRVGSIDVVEHSLSVTAQVNGEAPKSEAGRRTIALSETLTTLLSKQLIERRWQSSDRDPLLFPAQKGGPMDRAHWRQRMWLPAVERAGLDGLRFHDLRKSNATRLLHAGVDVRTAQARLGHADVRTTLMIYAQATTEADRAAASALAKSLALTPR